MKIPERRQWRRSGIFIVNFEHISHLVLVFLLLTLSRYMSTGIANLLKVKCFIQMLHEKKRIITVAKYRTANKMFGKASFIVCTLSIQGKEKQEIHFTYANTNNEKV